MISILIIIVSILAVGGLAYLIVNKLPAKFKPLMSLVLWVVIIFFGYKIYMSIMQPIKFNEIKKERYALVIENLKTIRDAEIAYAEVNRRFTDNYATLVSFIDTAKFAITEVKT